MKHSNISIFIPHNGCPHQCTFCNQREITGQAYQPTADDVRATLNKALSDLGDNVQNAEIAFFGGSFTAIDREYMISLLDAALPFTEKFAGIRISTRPDYIDDDILILLKKYNVTVIELGAQSTDNNVLRLNKRGHSRDDIINAAKLIKKFRISLGLQMMTGLYGSTRNSDLRTALDFIALKPDCVRIYPTVVVRNTELADLYNQGTFVPNTLDESVDLCAELMKEFFAADIDVIRVGLHYSESLAEGSIAANYHPAFRELCESKLLYDEAVSKLNGIPKGNVYISVNPKSLSKFIGQKRANIEKIRKLGYEPIIEKDNTLSKFEIKIKK